MIDSIQNDLVVLNRYRESDVSEMFRAVVDSHREISHWMSWAHSGYSLEEALEWVRKQIALWEEGEAYEFVLRDKQGHFLGGCGLNQRQPIAGFMNLGYWIRSDRTGNGYASSAARLLAESGFRHLSLPRIEIVVDVDNHASRRVAEKAGATREGILRNRLTVHGKTRDTIMYSFVPGDFGIQLPDSNPNSNR